MAYNEDLADRIREQLGSVKRVTEREMFGGIAFMVAGNMACGVQANELIVRLGPDLHQDALTRPGAHEWEFMRRPSKGMIAVGPDGLAEDRDLEMWVRLGVAYATSLPAKAVKKGAKKKPAAKKKAAAKKRVSKKAVAAKKTVKKAKKSAKKAKKSVKKRSR